MKGPALCVLVLLTSSLALAQVAVYSGRTLKKTVLMTVGNHASLAAQASCSDAPGCSATAPLFPARNIVCPAVAGKTCTFAMQAETPVFLASTGDLATLSCHVADSIGPQILADSTISFAESGPASFTFLAPGRAAGARCSWRIYRSATRAPHRICVCGHLRQAH